MCGDYVTTPRQSRHGKQNIASFTMRYISVFQRLGLGVRIVNDVTLQPKRTDSTTACA